MILSEFKLNSKQKDQFEKYASFLIVENEKYNLTSIKDINEIYVKHFYDSLKLIDVLNLNVASNFLDIGSGAGFPGIPVKILFPHLKLTIIEPTLKRCNFLTQLCELLELDNVEIINDRAENIKEEHRECFDVVTARAVANLSILLELTVPYVKINGSFLGLKGSSYIEEMEEAKNAIKTLNCKVVNVYNYDLPEELGKRVIINFLKTKKTNTIYPRKYAVIKKKHL